MEVPFVTNFNDCVAAMAPDWPHALVMDWWRRLDLTLHEYAVALAIVIRSRDRPPIEEVVPLNDAALVTCIRGLRHQRNRVTHKSCHLSSEDAAVYAREAFGLIAVLANRISHLEGKGQKPG